MSESLEEQTRVDPKSVCPQEQTRMDPERVRGRKWRRKEGRGV
jgi:hypothetical protein